MLITGVLMNHLEYAWFMHPYINLSWFIIAFLPVGLPVSREVLEAVKHKDIFNEFSLMLIATIGAFCIGEYPEAVAVMLFYTIGEMMQHKAVHKATKNIGALLDVRPETATVVKSGNLIKVSPQKVNIDDILEVRPGERVPLDGVLINEHATFDTSALTGESLPRLIDKGEEVLAGMIVYEQIIQIKVTRAYGQSALARILNLVKDASSRKAPAELFIRKFAKVYTPIVTILAALIVIVPALIGLFITFDYVFADWLYRGLVFLVISCPCALVISVPLGYFAGIGIASRNGILFKGGNYLYEITKINNVAFDKTGTLTTGTFEVVDFKTDNISKENLLNIMYSAENKSNHPIARAIVLYALENKSQEVYFSTFKEIAGHGIEAELKGDKIVIGNVRLLEKNNINVPKELETSTYSIVICAINGQYVGALMLEDMVKEDAHKAIKKLHKLGISEIHLLSGDKKDIVEKYASKLGIKKAYGDLLPENKADYIAKLSNDPNNKIAFVGDGMNDAPVLALSNVGVAMGGLGSDAAIESADVVIQADMPSKVASAIEIGKCTRNIVRENIIWAIGVKVIILIAGALGFTTLWAAVFADVGVALIAVLNSIRILYKKFE